MPATYEKIATTTLGSAASSIDFTSIPATYTDLRIVFVGTAATSVRTSFRFNSDSSTNYSQTFIYGDGSAATSARNTNTNQLFPVTNLSSTIPSMLTLDIFSYAGSTFKTSLMTGSFDKNGTGTVDRLVGLYRSTSAITTIKIFDLFGDTFAIGTTATLYGILKA